MVDYDRQVLHQMADGLYARAESIKIRGALTYGLVGGVLGAIVGYPSGSSTVVFFLAAAIAGGIGWASASDRAFLLQVEAQRLLCTMEIEKNTKPTG